MSSKDKRIDAYINKAQPFAIPVLKKLRELIHEGIPEVEETIKWGMPFFEYKGPVCNFASFKQHASFGFWKFKLLNDPDGHLGLNSAMGGEAMGNLGRLTSTKDLPPDRVIIGFLKQAAELNEKGIKVVPKKKKPAEDIEVPDYFLKVLQKNKAAEKVFNDFSASHRKEYIEWITEAKTEVTRQKRIDTTIEWLKEGKSRNWKYMKKF